MYFLFGQTCTVKLWSSGVCIARGDKKSEGISSVDIAVINNITVEHICYMLCLSFCHSSCHSIPQPAIMAYY